MLGFYLKSLGERPCGRTMGQSTRTRIVLMVAGLGLAAASPAGATSYYDASGAAIITINNVDTAFHQETTNPLVPQEVNLSGGNGWSVIATANDNNGGSVTADVGVPPNWSYDSNSYLKQISASASLKYEFSVVGGDLGSIVPVLVYGSGFASISDIRLGGNGARATATFQLAGPSSQLLNYSIDTVTSDTGSIGFTVNNIVNFQVGSTYYLSLSAYATGVSDENLDINSMPNGKYATFSAGVDPLFTILGDNAASFHFEGLPDSAIGDGAAPVPEPASWLMMIGGFGLTGLAMRRRTRVATAAAL